MEDFLVFKPPTVMVMVVVVVVVMAGAVGDGSSQ